MASMNVRWTKMRVRRKAVATKVKNEGSNHLSDRNRRSGRKGLLLGIVAFLLAIARSMAPCEPLSIDHAAEVAHERALRLAQTDLDPEFISQAFPLQVVTYDLTEHASAFAHLTSSPPEQVSTVDADADVRFLFELLRVSYPAYDLWGGNAAFREAEERVTQWLSAAGQSLDRVEVESRIRESLSFVHDAHFTVGHQSLIPPRERPRLLVDEENVWRRDQEGFYRLRADVREYLIEVEGDPPERWLRLSIDSNGELAHRIVATDTVFLRRVECVLRSEQRRTTERATLVRVAGSTAGRGLSAYESFRRGAVLVQRLSGMPMPDDPAMCRFLDDAESIGPADLVLLDLRGNAGGCTPVAEEWFLRVAGRAPLRTAYTRQLSSLTSAALARALGDGSERIDELEQILAGTKTWQDAWMPTPGLADTPPILVLIDNVVASSAEYFVEMLARSPSVLILGGTTAGVNLVGNNAAFSLPRTGIDVQFGRNLSIANEERIGDGEGIAPDIYLGSNALERVLRFVELYGADSVIDALGGD
jgi:hypothetical protein